MLQICNVLAELSWPTSFGVVRFAEVERELAEWQEVERQPVVGCRSVGFDGAPVRRCGISLVALPFVKGKFAVEFVHIVITKRLGKDGSSGNVEVTGIAFNDSDVWQEVGATAFSDTLTDEGRLPLGKHGAIGWGRGVVRFEAVAVHNDSFGAQLQTVEGAVHGKDGSVENVDAVDLFGTDDAYRPCQGIIDNLLPQPVTLGRRELLGIVDVGIDIVGWQNDGGGKDAACEASASGLVTSGFDEVVVIMVEKHGTGYAVIGRCGGKSGCRPASEHGTDFQYYIYSL